MCIRSNCFPEGKENGDWICRRTAVCSGRKEGSSLSSEEYVDQLRQMNRLTEDTIHAGQYLTVVYFQEAAE